MNFAKTFENGIDWNYAGYGKLWTYNLTYFEYLLDPSDIRLIHDFIDKIASIKDGMEPFSISLRSINWVKFLTYNAIKDQRIDDSLYAQYNILMDNLEYHLLGNHLLENGFSLLFGAYYFENARFYTAAKQILEHELIEQILSDGAHFELSPMYHQIMLYRLLDTINLVQHNAYQKHELLPFLSGRASAMLGWLDNMTYQNGTIPLFNDSANRVAPTSAELFDYARRLGIAPKSSPLGESGYRKIVRDTYECILDIGNIGPDYIPGHAHADTFNFELHIAGAAWIVDSGTSTYETNAQRDIERSTSAHNTVSIARKNSSDVWGSFRVANRAYVTDILETENQITATHDGYVANRVFHTRTWQFYDDKIIIEDILNTDAEATAFLHFHPDLSAEEIGARISADHPMIYTTYSYAEEFNRHRSGICVQFPFSRHLKIEIDTTP